MTGFKQNDPTAAISTAVAVLATWLFPTIEARDLSVWLTPTGATMTEFYIDCLVPGTGTPALPGQAAVTAEWIQCFSQADDETVKEVRRLGSVKPGNATTGARGFGWWRIPPCCGIRIRGKADGAGTADVKMGLGHG